MRVSIIVAAHNEGHALARTIASSVETCAQLDYEIIVADDASTDDSVEQAMARFPQVRVTRHERRRGASPAKHSGARDARGEVLVFLDGHCNPEYGAVRRLVEDVELLDGQAIVTPAIPALDVAAWKNDPRQVGRGYRLGLQAFDCGWVPLGAMRAVRQGRRQFHESPALIGCALAVARPLYDRLWGFDPHMRVWGVEDLDFGLKCWLMGRRILHDSEARIGHRFRRQFDNYGVPAEHVVANQLRMARKHFTHSVWAAWLDGCRQRHPGGLPGHPEGLWARVWQLFQQDRASVEQERSYLHAQRVRDEFWYAERFGLAWPRLHAGASAATDLAPAKSRALAAEPSASPSPPPCPVDDDQDEGCYESRYLMTTTYWQLPRQENAAWNWRPKTGGAIWEVVPTALTDGDSTTTLTNPPGPPNRNLNTIGTKCKYTDFNLKLSFRCPNMRGVWRNCNSPLLGPENWGNSGVKIFSLDGYEVQILDSFGATDTGGGVTDLGGCDAAGSNPVNTFEICGALYKYRAPDSNPVVAAVNAGGAEEYVPAGGWNTLEIEFMAARYKWNETTKKWDKQRCATITVKLGSEGSTLATVQSRIGLNPQAKYNETADLVEDCVYDTPTSKKGWCKARGPIFLQEHDSKVQFKGITIDVNWLPRTDGVFDRDWQRSTDCLNRQ